MKITSYVNPISGEKGDLTNMGQNLQNVVGVASLFGFFAIGQMVLKWLANLLGNKVPVSGTSIIGMPKAVSSEVTPQPSIK